MMLRIDSSSSSSSSSVCHISGFIFLLYNYDVSSRLVGQSMGRHRQI